MKKEHREYILANAGKKSPRQIAKELGIKERQVKRLLEKQAPAVSPAQPEKKPGPAAVPSAPKTVIVFLLLALVFAVYANALKGPFLMDDRSMIRDNMLVQSLGTMPVLFRKDIIAQTPDAPVGCNSYRPFQMVTYAVDHVFWKLKPMGYHLTNILLHLLNVFLVFLLAQRLFRNSYVSYFIAAMFGLNPVGTACVTYISGRADILVAMFMLISILFHARYGRSARPSDMAISVVAYFFAVLSKETAILVLPVLLFVHNTLFNRPGAFRAKSYAAYALPLALYIPMRLDALRGLTARATQLAGLAAGPRVLTSLKALFLDVRIILFPYDLHFGRTTNVEYSVFGSAEAMFTVAGLLAAGYAVYATYRKWEREKKTGYAMACFGGLWFLVSMAPTINIIPLTVFLADNWLYFPAIGIYMAVAAGLNGIWTRIQGGGGPSRKVFMGTVCLILLAYGAATMLRNGDYADPLRLCLADAGKRPSVKLYSMAARLCGERDDLAGAVKYSEKAIEVNREYPSPNIADVYFNLGITYVNFSEYGKAESMFRRVLSLDHPRLKREAAGQLEKIRKLKSEAGEGT